MAKIELLVSNQTAELDYFGRRKWKNGNSSANVSNVCTHLEYEGKHTINSESEFAMDASMHHADTLIESVTHAQQNLERVDIERNIKEAVADRGHHANQMQADCRL